MSIFTSCYFITFLHTPLTPSGLVYLMRSRVKACFGRGYILQRRFLTLMKRLIIFFSRDLGANLLGEAISGLLDGLIQLEVL